MHAVILAINEKEEYVPARLMEDVEERVEVKISQSLILSFRSRKQ